VLQKMCSTCAGRATSDWKLSDSAPIELPCAKRTAYTRQQKLLASDAAAFDLFGMSVAISGETVVVGAMAVAPMWTVHMCGAYRTINRAWQGQSVIEFVLACVFSFPLNMVANALGILY
jgi:FG-GAP repeat protein